MKWVGEVLFQWVGEVPAMCAAVTLLNAVVEGSKRQKREMSKGVFTSGLRLAGQH